MYITAGSDVRRHSDVRRAPRRSARRVELSTAEATGMVRSGAARVQENHIEFRVVSGMVMVVLICLKTA